MPIANIKSIQSFSSEDTNFPASNLINTNSTKKWKCEKAGEKSVFVEFQLERPSVITGIDIGNEHAAFIEVLVGKNGASGDKFKEILLTSSFMTPVESRSSSNPNRVRCFTESALVEAVVKEKWDLVKIICTQPFNNHIQYGLTFVTIHCLKELNNNNVQHIPSIPVPKKIMKVDEKPKSPAVRLGKFQMREDSSDSDSNTTSLFARWKETKSSQSSTDGPSNAAAIRDASNSAMAKNSTNLINNNTLTPKPKNSSPRSSSSSRTSSSKPSENHRNRDSLLYNKEDEQSNEKYDKQIANDKERLRKERSESTPKQSRSTDRKDRSSDRKHSGSSRDESSSSGSKADKNHESSSSSLSKRRTHSPVGGEAVNAKKIKRDITYKPFKKLLENVVIVMSGIQNPERDNIRRKALEMGAKYHPSWDTVCTHLICAFKNTPKYKEVLGKGKIVGKDWINKCHSERKRLPWRRFALDSKEGDVEESENEIFDISMKSPEPPPASPAKVEVATPVLPTPVDLNRSSSVEIQEVELVTHVVSDSDTEDEIERIRLQQKKTAYDDSAKYANSTEDDGFDNGNKNRENSSSPVPELFKGKTFFLEDNLKSTDVIKLERFIPLYKGEIKKSRNNVDYIISNKVVPTASQFKGEVVEPLWIFECNDMECLIPTRRYLKKSN